MKIINYILLFSIITFPAFGTGSNSYTILTKDEGGIVLQNLPETEFSSNIIDILKEEDPVLCVEALFHVDVNNDLTRLEELNTIMSISSLKGVEYYSETEKRYKVFVKDAYTVDDTGNRIPDISVITPESSASIDLFMKDSRFGKLNYSIDYFNTLDSYGMIMENKTKISYMLVPLVKPGEAKLVYQIIPTDKGYMFYGITMVKTETPSFLENRLSKSLYNRMAAVIDWFVDSVKTP